MSAFIPNHTSFPPSTALRGQQSRDIRVNIQPFKPKQQDTTHFSGTPSKGLWQSAKETKGLKHIIAATKEGTKRLFRGNWGVDIGISTLLFFLTLPLALLIPGSHFVLIPGYIALARSWHSAKGFFHGLFNPDKVLKPKPNPTQ